MKTKLMWIPFIPLFMAGVLLRVYQAMFDPKGVDTGLVSGGAITVGFAVIIILTFVVLAIMSRLDQRTSAFYEVKKNVPAGLFAIIAGAFLYAGTVTSFLQGITVPVLIDAIMSIIGGAAILVMGVSSFSGNNKAKNMPIFMVMPALWGFTRTFITFLGDTSISAESKDMSDIVFMALTTMFLFSSAMVYTNIKGRNAVKGCFLYGLTTILVTTAYTLAHTIYDLKNGSYNFIDNVQTYQFFALALFAFFFLVELSYGMKERSKEEYEEAGIDQTKFSDVFEEIDDEIDPESLIQLSDDPIMLQAEEAMRNADGGIISNEELKRYKESVQDDLDSEDFADTDNADDDEDDLYDINNQSQPDHSDANQDNEPEDDSEAKDISETYSDISDIDLDSINKLISEITGGDND